MGSLFRSEEMVLCQLFLQNDAAYNSVSNLGELGLVQFRDTNPTVSAFQRRFITQVRRCEEMERKLRYISYELKKAEIPEEDVEDNPIAPQPKEIIDLETTLEKLEGELQEVNSNFNDLKKSFTELTELMFILVKAGTFFADQEQHSHVETQDSSTLVANEVAPGSQQLGFISGVINRDRMAGFERMLWRVCQRNVFLKQAEMDTPIEDPITGEKSNKVVFILFFQGEQLKNRVKKICEGFHATLYPCPDSYEERVKMLAEVKTRIEDITLVLNQTQDHHHRLLTTAARRIQMWVIKVCKVKAIYHTMNMFNQDVTKECLIAECWCASKNLSQVQHALRLATDESGSYGPSIINRLETKEQPPTYNVVNKFTSAFQNIVDAYGVASYMEVNPAPYTIITFPFLFAVMFGDFGHGILMFLFALWMVISEKKFMSKKSDNELWEIMFGGRYIIILMGAFSIYTGLIYNDAYSKPVSIFHTGWQIPQDINAPKMFADGQLTYVFDPNTRFNGSVPYPFGVDPIWQFSKNKILFLNSYKMKLSIVFGVSQMLFGVILSLWNHILLKRYLNVFCDFIPQIFFLLAIFGYLVVMIFIKWVKFTAAESYCAPSLLITLINMFLFKYEDKPCYLRSMYSGQEAVQTALVAIAAICIPWMLLLKPIIKHFTRHQYQVTHSDDGHEGYKGFGDALINQGIHTIEYCLGSISHTASYLRLWALSLAHAELSEVLWTMVLRIGLGRSTSYDGVVAMYGIFAAWAVLTVCVLIIMEGLSAFLHALRLHWVEFQSKFYEGSGYAFIPFYFKTILAAETEA